MNAGFTWARRFEQFFWGLALLPTLWLSFGHTLPLSGEMSVVLYVLLWLIPLLGLPFSLLDRDQATEDGEGTTLFPDWFRDLRAALLLGLFGFQIIMIMMSYNFMFAEHVLEEFAVARAEWFVVLVALIGAIGAIWAVLARIDARRAFEQSRKSFERAKTAAEEALQAKDFAEKTYNAVAGTFDFGNILAQKKESMLPDHLRRVEAARSDLILFLGFPAVGFFRREMTASALFFLTSLTATLYLLRTRDLSGVAIRLVCLDKQRTAEAMQKSNFSKPDADAFSSQEERLHAAVRALASDKPDSFRHRFIAADPGLRFAITKKIEDEVSEEGIVWVVSDFLRGDQDPGQFKSAGFRTRDKEILRVLRQLCEDFIEDQTPQITIASGSQKDAGGENNER